MLEDLQALYQQILERFEAGDAQGAADLVGELTPADAADLLRSFERDQKVEVLRLLPAETAANVLSELDERSLPELLDILEDEKIVDMLDILDSDDAADVVARMEEEQAERVVDLLDRVDHQDAVELTELLRYPEDSAGGVMAKEFLSVQQEQTLGSVVAALRRMDEEDLVSHHFAFVTDAQDHLVGQVPLLKLLLSDPLARAGEVMDDSPLTVSVLEDQEKVANLFRRQDLFSVAVVDERGRMVGRITVDDVMDVMSEEASEDIARLAGSSEEEIGETSVMRISRARMPWLLVGIVGQVMAALVMSRFEGELQARVILAFFVPMVMGTAGNTGIQTSSIVIRQLATEEFDRFRAWRHLGRELLVGVLNGLLLGGLMMIVMQLWGKDSSVGLVIALALTAVVVIASGVATIVPLALHRLRIDPTLATGPFITTTNDLLGITIYLTLANWLLGRI